MTALDTMQNILDLPSLTNANLKYCVINKYKVPFKIDGSIVQPNNMDDFVSLDELCSEALEGYAGIGVSIQASKICAIGVDHCFESPFDIHSIDERGTDILYRFKDDAYCEFSFSGSGMRVLFRHELIDSYVHRYYIKNSKVGIEFYQPTTTSYRYVTVTGKPIIANEIKICDDKTLYSFLNTYMTRPEKRVPELKKLSPKAEMASLQEHIKYHYMTNPKFQDVWFSPAPGSGKDESERDYFLLSYMYAYITRDKEQLRKLFESSPFFQSKDSKHRYKWEYNNHRYFDYIYGTLGDSL